MDSIIQWLKDHFWHIESVLAHVALLWCFFRKPKSRKKQNKIQPQGKIQKSAPTSNTLSTAATVIIISVVALCIFGSISYVMFTRAPAEPQHLAHDDLSAEFKLKFQGLEIAMNSNRKTSYFIETPYYKIAPVPNEQMVSGKNGKYFYVDLSSSQRKAIRFASGEYALNNQDSALFQKALQQFQSDVMAWAQEGNAEIYIRGQADQLGNATFLNEFQEPVCVGKERFSDIWYHEKLTEKSSWFANERVRKKLSFSFGATLPEPIQSWLEKLGTPRVYRNTDLPELRARYLQCKYQQMYPIVPVSILAGRVNDAIGSKFREATLLMYIPEKSIQQATAP
jgi:hypothetical protein